MKKDFISECTKDVIAASGKSIPIDVVNMEFCKVCANPECSRSGMSKQGFFQRAANWEKDLFLDVKRDTGAQSQKVASIWAPPAYISSAPDVPSKLSLPIMEMTKDPEPIIGVPSPLPKPPPASGGGDLHNELTEQKTEPPVNKTKHPLPRNPFEAPRTTTPKPDHSSTQDTVVSSGSVFVFGD